ncbi:DUF3558 domain-containing protein [Actinophytocola sediminis]
MRMPRVRFHHVAVVLSATLLAACDSEASPPPPTSTTSSPTVTTTTFTPPAGVPRVANPLDGSTFEQDPCTSLTPAQRTQFDLGDGRLGTGQNPEQSDDNCTYFDHDPKTELLVYVNYYPDDGTGLTHRYKQHHDGQWPEWEPTDVNGYPAVGFHYNPAEPSECNLDVGISDTTVFNIKVLYYQWKGLHGQDVCAEAKTIASAVLTTIKAAN